MKITDIRINKSIEKGSLLAYVQVTLDDTFVVKDFKIIDGVSGIFVAMPSKRLPNGDFKDTAHPIDSATRTMFTETILNAYKKME